VFFRWAAAENDEVGTAGEQSNGGPLLS
jgi:hypothetical protein